MHILVNALILISLIQCKAQISKDVTPGKATGGAYAQLMTHEDGKRSSFTRSPDNDLITKTTRNGNGVLVMSTIYRLDRSGNPLNCKIYDGLKTELFKARYGYHPETGLLVEEQLFDSRVERKDPATGEPMPVRRFIYTYDANGKQNQPISIVLTAGKTSNEVYGKDKIEADPYTAPTGLSEDPFTKKTFRKPSK